MAFLASLVGCSTSAPCISSDRTASNCRARPEPRSAQYAASGTVPSRQTIAARGSPVGSPADGGPSTDPGPCPHNRPLHTSESPPSYVSDPSSVISTDREAGGLQSILPNSRVGETNL
eukprot:4107-Prorocentrum_minimum.AAC.1